MEHSEVLLCLPEVLKREHIRICINLGTTRLNQVFFVLFRLLDTLTAAQLKVTLVFGQSKILQTRFFQITDRRLSLPGKELVHAILTF